MGISVIPHSNAYRSPIKLFESMARGRAIVAPRTEPIGMVVRDGENGLLFEPGNDVDLRRQLDALIRDRALRERLGAQALADIRGKHTWNKHVTEVLREVGNHHAPGTYMKTRKSA
jgi:glycosyltransferase involved in cell wall biosynthesis